MTVKRTHFPVEIAGVKRRLPLFQVAPGLRIAILNILGDTELVQAAARQLGRKLSKLRYDVLVTAEAKSIPLVYALSVVTKKPYVVLRKTYKSYMGNVVQAETLDHDGRAADAVLGREGPQADFRPARAAGG